MFKKTAGVLILFAALFTLSVGRVSADREVWHADGFGGCSNAYCQIVPGNEGGWIQLGVLNKGVTHEVRVSTNTVFQEGDKLIVGLYDINVILTPDAFVTNAGDSVFSFVATEWTTHFMVYGNCPHTPNCGATAVSVWEIASTPTSIPTVEPTSTLEITSPPTITTVPTSTSPTLTSAKKDTTPPTLSLSTNLSKAYLTAPTLFGSASDNSGVSGVEYSTDGGGSWIVTSVKGKGGKQVTFSFSLGVLDDGNYTFSIRAKDSAGNVSESKSYTLVIDKLPPQVGTIIFSAGPQIFTPTKEGVLVTVSGLEQKITLSAIGGPISLEISGGVEKFNLTKNPESGLWSGMVKFDNPGTYELTSKSVDGAKNETIQQLAKVLVLEPGKVSYSGKSAPGAAISVYVFEPTLGQFILWDGGAYGQSNPQKTNENGNYSLLLPAGRYYIEAKLSAFIKLQTQIFELSAPSVINADLSGGSLLIPFIANEIKIEPIKDFPSDIKIESELIGGDFPLALVKKVTGVELASGKPRVVSILATWLPDTAEQIKILESLDAKEFGVTVIVPQESKSAVEIYKKRGSYSIEMLSDPDGKLVEPLALRFLSTHFFLDKDAKIKMIRFGVLNESELLGDLR